MRAHAGAARWAYNYALAQKYAGLTTRQNTIETLIKSGYSAKAASVRAPKVPNKQAIQKSLNQTKGDDRVGVDGVCPWWHTVSTYAFQSAMIDADRAWENWLSSITGNRRGKPVGRPKFKRKSRSRDSFRIHHNVAKPSIRPDGYRRIIVPRLGSLRLHGSAKRLCRALSRGAVIQSVTIARAGHRWYASVLAREAAGLAAPSHHQLAAGTVGVDAGIHHLAALSTGETIANPRHFHANHTRLVKAERALARTKRGSGRRRRAAERLGRLHHEVAERRATTLHTLTKRLATGWATVAIEDLHVAGMTRSARGTIETPALTSVPNLASTAQSWIRRQVRCVANLPTKHAGTAPVSLSAIVGFLQARRARHAERKPSFRCRIASSTVESAVSVPWTEMCTQRSISPHMRWSSPRAPGRR